MPKEGERGKVAAKTTARKKTAKKKKAASTGKPKKETIGAGKRVYIERDKLKQAIEVWDPDPLDESMSGWRPKTSKCGGLPNITHEPRMPVPLGTMLRNAVECVNKGYLQYPLTRTVLAKKDEKKEGRKRSAEKKKADATMAADVSPSPKKQSRRSRT